MPDCAKKPTRESRQQNRCDDEEADGRPVEDFYFWNKVVSVAGIVEQHRRRQLWNSEQPSPASKDLRLNCQPEQWQRHNENDDGERGQHSVPRITRACRNPHAQTERKQERNGNGEQQAQGFRPGHTAREDRQEKNGEYRKQPTQGCDCMDENLAHDNVVALEIREKKKAKSVLTLLRADAVRREETAAQKRQEHCQSTQHPEHCLSAAHSPRRS